MGLKPYWKELLLGRRGGGDDEEKIRRVTPTPLPTRPSAAALAQENIEALRTIQPQLEGLFPGRAGLEQALTGQLTQALQTPQFITPEEQAATEAIRGRETERLQQAIRTRANLGGGLFGGRAAGREERAVSELGQQFAQQDINQRLQRQALLFGTAAPFAQQQQQLPFQFLPSPGGTQQDILQRALAEQPQTFFTPAGGGGGFNVGAGLGGAASGALSGAAIGSIVPGLGTAVGAGVGGLAGLLGGLR